MFNRTKHRMIHFDRPFTLPGVDETIAAGDYEIDDDEELIEGLSWAAYRRVATFIKLPATVENRYRMRLIQIAPDELARLVARWGANISHSPKQ
ncbi:MULTISPECIES: hypothetical protein [unclassified Ensifer]|uniref:hypothetical protein n=1 Tax=unclassified Ensifer TaxID=2633371 RepID=UPI00081345C0|nr:MULTISPECIES: hypothetical protein [unclassified Ensifer]OCP05764.1 hypothetical protein BBX50_04570 [Ensifer sp. LC11]OCP06509.1 hypothetical protein BC374_04635 [Ensifer sp. LC13]OCP06765.1 hypothetical protein BC362_11530 [Ensifer sp. LC14]OCP31252.1 hypothetical protein BC364_05460 [Ensifer sp. LC499]